MFAGQRGPANGTPGPASSAHVVIDAKGKVTSGSETASPPPDQPFVPGPAGGRFEADTPTACLARFRAAWQERRDDELIAELSPQFQQWLLDVAVTSALSGDWTDIDAEADLLATLSEHGWNPRRESVVIYRSGYEPRRSAAHTLKSIGEPKRCLAAIYRSLVTGLLSSQAEYRGIGEFLDELNRADIINLRVENAAASGWSAQTSRMFWFTLAGQRWQVDIDRSRFPVDSFGDSSLALALLEVRMDGTRRVLDADSAATRDPVAVRSPAGRSLGNADNSDSLAPESERMIASSPNGGRNSLPGRETGRDPARPSSLTPGDSGDSATSRPTGVAIDDGAGSMEEGSAPVASVRLLSDAGLLAALGQNVSDRSIPDAADAFGRLTRPNGPDRPDYVVYDFVDRVLRNDLAHMDRCVASNSIGAMRDFRRGEVPDVELFNLQRLFAGLQVVEVKQTGFGYEVLYRNQFDERLRFHVYRRVDEFRITELEILKPAG